MICVAGATQNAEIKYKTFITFDELLWWNSYMSPKHHTWGCFLIKSVHVQCLAKVFGPLELCDLLPHFKLQT